MALPLLAVKLLLSVRRAIFARAEAWHSRAAKH
jgi:hypothetical protein